MGKPQDSIHLVLREIPPVDRETLDLVLREIPPVDRETLESKPVTHPVLWDREVGILQPPIHLMQSVNRRLKT